MKNTLSWFSKSNPNIFAAFTSLLHDSMANFLAMFRTSSSEMKISLGSSPLVFITSFPNKQAELQLMLNKIHHILEHVTNKTTLITVHGKAMKNPTAFIHMVLLENENWTTSRNMTRNLQRQPPYEFLVSWWHKCKVMHVPCYWGGTCIFYLGFVWRATKLEW